MLLLITAMIPSHTFDGVIASGPQHIRGSTTLHRSLRLSGALAHINPLFKSIRRASMHLNECISEAAAYRTALNTTPAAADSTDTPGLAVVQAAGLCQDRTVYIEPSNLTHTGSTRTLLPPALLKACHSAYSKVCLSTSDHSLWTSPSF